MRTKCIYDGDLKTFAVILDTGEEVVECLTRFAKEQFLTASQVTAIGALSQVTLGYFDFNKKDYNRIPVREQVEVVSLVGDIALEGSTPKLHAHLVVGKSDGSTCGGHLLDAMVRPTLEVIINEAPSHLRRKFDADSGLALIRF